MTTADLINKKEEEKKNNPPQSTKTSTFKPIEGMSMEEARVLGGMPEPERENAVSLYDDGVNSGNKKTITGSPINTKEYADFREKLIQPQDFGVETEEQKKKRERADFIKQGLTGFTEGLSALANLYYTTKGAPSQKLTSQMPALQQQLYQERLERDKKLENYRAWIRDKARRDDERAWQNVLFDKQQKAAEKTAERKAKLDAEAAQIKYLRDLGLIDAKKAADLEVQLGKVKSDKELEDYKHNYRVALAGVNHKNIMAREEYRGNAGGRNRTVRVPIGGNGEYVEYRKDDLTNPTTVSSIYHLLPKEYMVRKSGKKEFVTDENGEIVKDAKGKSLMEYPIDENPSTHDMSVAIGKAIADGYLTEMAPEISVGGEKGSKPNSSDEDKVPPSRRGKKEDDDNVPPSRRNK